MVNKKIKVFLIAGEASGDRLGAKLMNAIKRKVGEADIEFHGIGGDKMIAEGISLTAPINNIGLIGLLELIPHLFKLIYLIKKTTKDIDKVRPDVVITIDSWGFVSRVVKRLKRRDKMKLVHYVSPTVWAYKAYRIETLEKFYDLVLSIFPFEPRYYEGKDVVCKYVGHPMSEDFGETVENRDNEKRETRLLGIMAGSREGEVRKMLPIFINAANKFLADKRERFVVVLPVVNERMRELVESYKDKMKFYSRVMDTSKMTEPLRRTLLQSFDLALVKSGTSSLELTFAGVPMIVAYKINRITELVAKYVYGLHKRIKYVSMTNLLLDELVIRECIQERCNAEEIAKELNRLVEAGYRKKQLSSYSRVVEMLSGEDTPSDKAAESVLELMKLIDIK